MGDVVWWVSVGRKLIYQLAPHPPHTPALTLFKRTGVAFGLPMSSHQRSLEGKNHTFDKGKIKIIHPSALAGNPMHHTPQHSRFPLCKRLWIRTNHRPKPFARVGRVSLGSVAWLLTRSVLWGSLVVVVGWVAQGKANTLCPYNVLPPYTLTPQQILSRRRIIIIYIFNIRAPP